MPNKYKGCNIWIIFMQLNVLNIFKLTCFFVVGIL